MLYIVMERTQIYLSEGQTRELDRRARQRGMTRSHLIREAVEQYLGQTWDPERFSAAVDAVAGMWADRDDLDALYADLKRRDRDRLTRLWGDRLASEDGPDTDDPK
jgi:metal-responsive CopG/Arc/MetJ family transcriptional regulator